MAIDTTQIANLWAQVLAKADKTKPHYTILLPPPNITGSLHIGHFLNWSIQDLLMRYAYMNGFYPNWISGIDHAGIATQFVVERQLAQQNIKRQDLGIEKFNEKIWEWKKEAEELISQQAVSFAFFFDWAKHRFTMDTDYKKHVINAFVKLYNDGLIKKSNRITNWDTEFQTALSDLEVIEKIEKKPMYIITFFGENYAKNGEKIEIATTRPEVMFANAAVCVNPDDERYKNFLGHNFLIPIINKPIPLIHDQLCEKDKGTGVLQITPAHSVMDNMIAKKHNLDYIQIIDKTGCLNNLENASILPEKYVGKSIVDARKLILEDLGKMGQKMSHLVETREWSGVVYYPEKSHNAAQAKPIETIMTQQWFLDMEKMAKMAIEHSHEIEFIPENIINTFFHWMKNIQPWCISRQIWWGHRIPIWYKKDGTIICAHSQEEAEKIAGTNEITQETDVLDTWFSSALWPIAMQEKASENFDNNGFAPTQMLVTGKDILFFWVSRMIMFSLYFKKQIPFERVYFNSIVRDGNNQKMSKTKGNVLNPLDLQEEYGHDALRYALLRKSSFGKDIALQMKEVEDGRAFITKLKNATKFINQFMSKNYKSNEDLDNWMRNKIVESKAKIDQAIKACAFHEAMKELYDLFWNNFCAWYIEGCKIYPSSNCQEFLQSILKIAHPMLPFGSEECFQELNPHEKTSILDYTMPDFGPQTTNFENIINITKFIRKLIFISNLPSFYIEDKTKAEQIKFFTKIAIQENLMNKSENNLEIIIYNTKIYIEKSYANSAKEAMQNELFHKKAELDNLIARINTHTSSIPAEILEEWANRRKIEEEYINNLKTWLVNLTN